MNVLWLQSGGCGGCSMSLLCASTPDWFGLLKHQGIEMLWHPSLSLANGVEFLELLKAIQQGKKRLDVLCIEGAVLQGPHGTGAFHQLAGTTTSMADVIGDIAHQAQHVVAIGSCAAWGGMTRSEPNITQACGLQYEDDQKGGHLGSHFKSKSGLSVINIAGCPTHPDWVFDTLFALSLGQLSADDLDEWSRPRFYADQLVHHGCSRNEYYEFKASAVHPSDLGCLMEHRGCKGTQVHADCNIRLWNGVGSCTRAGYACIACTEPKFQSPGHAFAQTPKLAGIPIGLPTDMPKAWFVALASLSKSATPKRVKINAVSDHLVVQPTSKKRYKD